MKRRNINLSGFDKVLSRDEMKKIVGGYLPDCEKFPCNDDGSSSSCNGNCSCSIVIGFPDGSQAVICANA